MADGAMVVDLGAEADPDAIPVDSVEVAAEAAKAKPNTATAMMAAAKGAAAAEKTKKAKAATAKEAAATKDKEKRAKGETKKAPRGDEGAKAAAVEEDEEEEGGAGGGAGAGAGAEKGKEKAVGDDKLVQLPQARIKRIIRADKDVANVASDALLAITRSTVRLSARFQRPWVRQLAHASTPHTHSPGTVHRRAG